MKKTALKPISKKERVNKAKLAEVYAEMDEDIENMFCSGCGDPNQLTHSHTIPRSKRKDLEAERENIVWDCLKCHDLWGSGNFTKMKQLNSFEKRMRYIKRVDIKHYNIIMSNG